MNLSVSLTKKEFRWGLVYLCLQLLVLPVVLVAINSFLGNPLSEAALNILFFFINFLCILLIFHRFLWLSFKIFLERLWYCLRIALACFILYFLSNFLISWLVLFIDPDFVNINDSSIALMAGEHYSLIALCTVLLVPITEEALFRGVVFHSLYRKNRFLGYFLSTAIFASIHILGYIASADPLTILLCFIQYIPAGIFLAWSYAKSNTIWVPILIHMAVNEIAISVMR